MLYSNSRKQILCGWLQVNNLPAYRSALRLQKFLFFYEVFSKVNNEQYDFIALKGYKRGPVFSSVWGDYTKELLVFDNACLEKYNANQYQVISIHALRASFLVTILTENELSDLTHQFHIWSSKSELIMDDAVQVELDEHNFDQHDYQLARKLEQMYPVDLLMNSKVVSIGNINFVFSKKDYAELSPLDYEILKKASEYDGLHNPVYVEKDEEGVLCFD